MTRDDIINLARQHGKPVQEQNAEVGYLFTLDGVNALLAAEREACVQIVEAEAMQYAEPVWAVEIINDIRARGQA
jgi:hypothetical protein